MQITQRYNIQQLDQIDDGTRHLGDTKQEAVIVTGQRAGRLFVGCERMKNLLHCGGCPELAGYEGLHFWLRKRSVGKECFLTNSQRCEGARAQIWNKSQSREDYSATALITDYHLGQRASESHF